jgi:ubiquitin-like modifier-activating enzyme ATG7
LTASLATELYISLLQHPLSQNALLPSKDDPPFGSVPHQIRGTLSNWQQHVLSGHASPYCSACGDRIVEEWVDYGEEFVKRVCARGGGKEIERVCGLEEVKKGFEEGWDGDEGEEDDWEL